jgi:Aromatic-ring-opening dioxygenase LigAB, LigA subunit
MSLYATQKFLFELNRGVDLQRAYAAGGADRAGLLDRYELTAEEREAVDAGDIGKLYVLGCNGQLLMHFAPLLGLPWADYIAAMREGVRKYGPVRAGVYAMTTAHDERVAGI